MLNGATYHTHEPLKKRYAIIRQSNVVIVAATHHIR